MNFYQKRHVAGVLCLAFLVFFLSFAWYFWRKWRNKRRPDAHSKALNTMLALSGFLVVSVGFIRFAVGSALTAIGAEGKELLSAPEELLNSFFATLRTFGMEEEYAEYVKDIRIMLNALIPPELTCGGFWRDLVLLFASVLHILAPIYGGAIVLEAVARIFPKMHLWFINRECWRKKFYFSELNEASLALAKSISISLKAERPALIFTDAYVDSAEEKEYELLLEAKQLGAICIRDDLVHAAKPVWGKVDYYLMDEDEFSNLQTLTSLTENTKSFRRAMIYLFVQSDAYVQVEQRINKNYENKGKNVPRIVPVRIYQNLVQKLFTDVPLYEPIVHKGEKDCSITILGNGIIGTEAFLSAYWFGQMKLGTKKEFECGLKINVVSKDPEDVFWSKIDYINPEIKQTVRILDQETEKNCATLLNCGDGKNAAPYCEVRYIKADLKNGGFWNESDAKMQKLLSTDYMIVALGNDADNISVAERIRRAIGKEHIEGKQTEDRTVIAYAVFDSELAESLNKQKYYPAENNKPAQICMYAFGGLDEVYSCENVYKTQLDLWAKEIGAAYARSQNAKVHLNANISRAKNENSNYSYWADMARAMHVKYKVFALGWIKTSIFDSTTATWEEDHRKKVKEMCELYRVLAVAPENDEPNGCSELKADLVGKQERLAWLEHRRWNAFTRTMGYRSVNAARIFGKIGAQKDMGLKLHACLTETGYPSTDGVFMLRPIGTCVMNPRDGLDMVSCLKHKHDVKKLEEKLKKIQESPETKENEISEAENNLEVKKKNPGDYKEYDYYRKEFGDEGYLTPKQIREKLEKGGAVERAIDFCSDPENYKDEEQVRYTVCSGMVRLISSDAVKLRLEKYYRRINDADMQECCDGGKVKGAVKFCGTWFAKRSAVRRAMKQAKAEKEETNVFAATH